MKLGLLVNPDAGLGGRVGLKGSDGKADEARSMGAEDRSGPRTTLMLENFSRRVCTSASVFRSVLGCDLKMLYLLLVTIVYRKK